MYEQIYLDLMKLILLFMFTLNHMYSKIKTYCNDKEYKMIIEYLMSLLIASVCVLFIVFFIERKHRKSQFEECNKLLNNNIVALSNLSNSLDKYNENLTNELKQLSADVEKEIDETRILIDKLKVSTAKDCNELENLIYTIKSQIEDSQKEIEISLRKYTEDKVNIKFSDLNLKLLMLVTIIEQINTENKELRKKIEFFSEIESDSKQLNEIEDTNTREALIQQALREISKPQNYSELEGIEKKNTDIIVKGEEKTFNKKPTKSFLPEEVVKDSDREHLIFESGILDEEQNKALMMMEYSQKNMFVTGKAGTGKSFLLEVFERATHKKTIKLAPTGIAALNIGGVTLHSTFGFYNLEKLNVEDISQSTLRIKSEKRIILKNVDVIIIDEISMVRADTFDKIDKILRIINKNDKPFGGKQMLIFGDLFQLPPIVKKQEIKYLTDRYGGIYFFHSDSYENGSFNFIELSLNHRQKDDSFFFDILNRIRDGKTTNDDINALNKRLIQNSEELRRVLTLFPKKADAEKVNKKELKKIEAKEYSYNAKIIFNKKTEQTSNLDSIFPISDVLKLKRGALVMLVANDIEKRWVNGTIGIISSLKEDKIEVSIDGYKYDVLPVTFSEQEAIYKNGRIEYEEVLKIEQFPIVLAYAITIHKSQGMTYKKVACNISACFASGQAYVALSRCSSLEGLYLLYEVTKDITKVDNVVKEFYLNQVNSN